MKTYNSQPSNPLPEDVEHISELEYLEASAKAARNGIDKPANIFTSSSNACP